MKIVVDYDKCTGLGMCEAEAPDLFEIQEDGSLTVLNDRPGADNLAEAQAAVDSCPNEALSLVAD